MLKADFQTLQAETRLLALQIGLRPAARAMHLDEERVKKWAQRGKWNMRALSPALDGYAHRPKSPEIPNAVRAMTQILESEGHRTRLGMARTARRAFEHCDDLPDRKLLEVGTAIALDKHRAVAESAHGWRNAATQVAVQVNVPMPTQQERDEMRQLDAKLDAFAKLLKANTSEAQ